MEELLRNVDESLGSHYLRELAQRHGEEQKRREKRARRKAAQAQAEDVGEASESSSASEDDPYMFAALEHIRGTSQEATRVADDAVKQQQRKIVEKYKKAIGADKVLAEEEAEDPGQLQSSGASEQAAQQPAESALQASMEEDEHAERKSNIAAVRRFVPDRPCPRESDLCCLHRVSGESRGMHWIARYSFPIPDDVSKVPKELKQGSKSKTVAQKATEHTAFQARTSHSGVLTGLRDLVQFFSSSCL